MTCIKFWGPPGTGKTTRLLLEIENLQKEGYYRSDFVVTTFRRQMADELIMKLGWKDEGIVNTIHGVCRGLAEITKIIADKDRAEFCKIAGLNFEKSTGRTHDLEPQISSGKIGNMFFDARSYLINNLLDFKDIYQYPHIEQLEQLVPDAAAFMEALSKRYTQWKIENQFSDFDDMLKVVYDQELIPAAKILIVDEFQDMTPLQYAIICMWSKQMEHVRIAGDPRQTVYGFWGANAKFFEQHDGDLVVLDTSHRLPEPIWNYAKKILDKVNLKVPEIKTTKKFGILSRITMSTYQDMLPKSRKSTYHLVRINEMGKPIALDLARAGIPFLGISGWGRSQIHLYNAILKIRNIKSGASDTTLIIDEMEAILSAYPKAYFSQKKAIIRKLFETEKSFTFSDIRELSSLDIFGRRGLWHEIAGDSVLDNVLGGLKDHDNLGRIKILSALKNHKQIIITPDVTVSTIHGVKGSEADYVFLHDSITRKIHDKLYSDLNQETQESEAQLFYVGATRPRLALFLIETGSQYTYALPDVGEK